MKRKRLEERKKRDTPRDSDRREADKLKINEEEEDLDEYMAITASDQFGTLICLRMRWSRTQHQQDADQARV